VRETTDIFVLITVEIVTAPTMKVVQLASNVIPAFRYSIILKGIINGTQSVSTLI